MMLFHLAGTWLGTNGFRLMPDDPLAEFPATASVTSAAGGHLTLVAYAWVHPVDGPQDGMLVIGSAGGAGSLIAMWADSWHQQPVPMSLSGRHGPGDRYELEGEYAGGWGWRIVFEVNGADDLRMRMDNVVPGSQTTADMPGGPYPVMVMRLSRG